MQIKYGRWLSKSDFHHETELDFHALSLVPQAAPQLLLKATSPTSLRATWTPLSKEKAQGVVTEYKIQWRRKGQASSRVEQVKGDITDFTITGKFPSLLHSTFGW
jgi:hypothetical protein